MGNGTGLQEKDTTSTFETGDIPPPWKGFWNPWNHDRDDALKGIPRLQPAEVGKPIGKDQIPRGQFPERGKGSGINAGRWGKGIVPPGGMVGPRGCGPCVGVILIPDNLTNPIIILHFKAGADSGSSGLDAAGAKNLKGYKAIINGGEKNGGLLYNVIQEIKRRGGTIGGYVPAASVGCDDKGKIYWTDPPSTDGTNKTSY